MKQTKPMIAHATALVITRKDKGPVKRSESEKRIVEEAKALLMDRNGMTEPEAFRYIQKTSMDQGRTMAESAQMIIMLNG